MDVIKARLVELYRMNAEIEERQRLLDENQNNALYDTLN